MIWSVFVVCFHEVYEKRKAILIRPDIINIAKRNLYRKKAFVKNFVMLLIIVFLQYIVHYDVLQCLNNL